MTARNKAQTGFRRAAATVCLLAFCFGPAKFLPVALAFSAGVEGSHAVRMERDFNGDVKVVLHHTSQILRLPGTVPAPAAHRHGVVSKVICGLGSPSHASDDHVARFATGAPLETINESRLQARAIALVDFPGAAEVHRSLFPANRWPGPSRPAGEASFALLRCLRSTSLLI